MKAPNGVAVDTSDNVYIVSQHKLQFNRAGNLLNTVGGSGKDMSSRPESVAVYENYVFVCDDGNERIQVFNLDLKYIRTISRSQASIVIKWNCQAKRMQMILSLFTLLILLKIQFMLSVSMGHLYQRLVKVIWIHQQMFTLLGSLYVVDCQVISQCGPSGELVTSFQIRITLKQAVKELYNRQ